LFDRLRIVVAAKARLRPSRGEAMVCGSMERGYAVRGYRVHAHSV
jgi:predicted nucleotidyltransferase